MNTVCRDCGKPLGKRNKTGYCNQCRGRHVPRCSLCGQATKPDGEHDCKNIDVRGERRCECGTPLNNVGWERWSTVCRRCSKRKWREIERQERHRLRQEFGGKCCRCGYDRCQAALHFHHVDASEKYDWNVKGKGGASIREVREHPERFQLVCACCHIEIHEGERQCDGASENTDTVTTLGA